MTVELEIEAYIAGQSDAKRVELLELHQIIQELMPEAQLWYLDGRDANNKTVTNPNIGYGKHIIQYANGTSKEFYRIGLSGNTTGISVYILGIDDKKYLAETFGKTIGKATVTGYCIKFKTLKDINIEVLKAAICFGAEQE